MALRIVEEIAHEAAQQPRVTAHHDEFAVEGAAVVMGAFLRHQGQQVDILRGRWRGRNVEPACQQDFLDQIVEFRDIAGDIGLDLGVGLGLEKLKAKPYARQRRAQFVRRVGQQQPVRADQFFDPGSGAIEARGEPSDLVASFDGDPGREVPGPERFDARLQALDAPGQAAHHRIGKNRDRDCHGGQEEQEAEHWNRRPQQRPRHDPASIRELEAPHRPAANAQPAAILVGRLRQWPSDGGDRRAIPVEQCDIGAQTSSQSLDRLALHLR